MNKMEIEEIWMHGKSRNCLPKHWPANVWYPLGESRWLDMRIKGDYDIVLVPKELSLTGETTSFTEFYVLYLHKYSHHFSQ